VVLLSHNGRRNLTIGAYVSILGRQVAG
jgi:hypothetical protein